MRYNLNKNPLERFFDWLMDEPIRFTVAVVVTVVSLTLLLASLTSPEPKLAEGVMEVKQVTCFTGEEGEFDCKLLVRVPGNPVVKGREYIKVLAPGEELAPEEGVE